MNRHGHVVPMPDGFKADCGGPMRCNVCRLEFYELHKNDAAAAAPSTRTAEVERLAREMFCRYMGTPNAKRNREPEEIANVFRVAEKFFMARDQWRKDREAGK